MHRFARKLLVISSLLIAMGATMALPIAHADDTGTTELSADQTSVSIDVGSDASNAPSAEPVVEEQAPSTPVVEESAIVEPTVTLEVAPSSPELTTDKPDYEPTETVTIFGKLFSAFAKIFLTISGNSEVGNHYFEATSILHTDALGAFVTQLVLDNVYRPFYDMVARNEQGDTLAIGAFTDAPGAAGDLDQCSNGSSALPVPCTGTAWQNGNLNSNQAHYTEGDSAPYRIVLTNVPTTGTNTLVIEYDIMNSSKHAIDFLTSYDRTETTANPCSGILPCVAGTAVAIPAPSSVGSPVVGMPTASFNAIAAADKKVSVFNGAITSLTYVSQGSLTVAQSSTQVQIQFTANDPTVVIAWGGHIGSSLDWGAGNSAGGISGSPYHMRFIELNGKGGNQDRSLSAGAIAPPAPQGTIGGVKFNDLNGNGAMDPSDTLLSGVTINLNGAATGTMVTGADGSYSFGSLLDGTYTVCEVVQSGWTQTFPVTGASCAGGSTGYTVVVSNGAIVGGRDFGNTQFGSITIDKVTNPSADAQSFAFTLTGPTSGNANLTDVAAPASLSGRAPGVYTLTETPVAGWTLTSATCTGVTTSSVTDGVMFTLGTGQNPVCTFTNTKDARLTVVKVVTNNNGGTNVASDFPLMVDGNSVTNGVSNVFATGSHTVSETQQAGYAQVSITGDCAANGTVTLNPGDNKTCTITNDDIAPRLTLVKTVTNDDGGSLQVSQVPLFVDGNAVTSGVSTSLSAGAHIASETNQAGYTASVWGGDCAADGSITLNPGDVKTCTINNNDIAPKLTLVKTVVNDDGGSLTVAQVPLFVDGNAVTSGIASTLAAGAHVASETNQAGYTASVWGGDCAANGSITLLPGDNKTCTITNDDIAPTLTLVKTVTNNDGGTLLVSQVPLFINGSAALSGVPATLSAGAHVASETNQAGYAASAWGGDCDATGNVSLLPGDNKTCTITNDDIAPTLTLVKTVLNNNGGTLTVAQVPLFIDGNATTSGNAATLSAGAHVATETNQIGYSASAWGGDCDADGTITLLPGDNKTCTITNDDIAPKLTLVKTVVNDDGGSLTVAQVPLFVDGNSVATGAASTLSAGAHVASETNQSGYSASAWGGDCAADGSITLNPGDDKTCTITNDDIAPKLTLVKTVVNNNGGTLAVEDVPLFVDGNSVTSNVASTLMAGAHVASETNAAGYTASAWGGDCDESGNVSLAPGDNKTCTITNDDQPATLIVKKHVINDDGGTMDASDFNLAVSAANASPATFSGDENGTTVTLDAGSYSASETVVTGYASSLSTDCSGTIANGETKTCVITNDDIAPTLTLVKTVLNDDGGSLTVAQVPLFIDGTATTSGNAVTLSAGAHVASETNAAGYTASVWGGACDENGNVSLLPGDNKTCTITNDDIAPKLTLVKTVTNDNGGSLTVEQVPLFVDGTGVASGVASTLMSGAHTASETNQAGYTASTWGGDCDEDGNVSLAPGDDKTCTITNDDIQPTLTLIKTVTNDDGGTLGVSDFALNVSGTPTTSGVALAINAGSYVAAEANQAGYAASAWGGDCAANGSITLTVGENKTCTITNDDIAPTLTLVKTVVNNNGGSLTVAQVPLFINGVPAVSGAASTLTAGAHVATETNPTGYTASVWGGACDENGNVSLLPGDDKTCTITNNDQPATLIVVKHVINDDGGTMIASDFDLAVTATNASQTSFSGDEDGTMITLDAGAYAASETVVSGYASSMSTDCSGTIANGETKTCTITNDDIAPKLTLVKTVVNNNGGTLTAEEVPLFIDNVSVTSGEASTLLVGAHVASETNPTGYTASVWGGACAADGSITLNPGDDETCTITNNDMPGEIRGVKFNDLNGNGVKDSGEPGLSGWTINAFDGTQLVSTVTGTGGVYTFSNLNTGLYVVTETQQSGWTQTSTDPAAIALGLGQTVADVNFGNFRNGSVSGYKWSDADMSSVLDGTEVKLAGWTIYADLNVNGVMDSGEPSAVTTTTGYTIPNLAPGTYAICEVGQAGWSQVYPASGACHTVVISTSGQTVANKNFGNVNEHEGTIGLWRNWNKHNKYTQLQINGWLATIDGASGWLMAEKGYTADTTGVVNLINDATKYCSQFPDKLDCADRKFRAQYMVNRLNVLSGRKSLTSTYNLSGFGGAMGYLGISPSTAVTMGTYITKVEAKAATSPNRNQFLQMASVSDYINNQGL